MRAITQEVGGFGDHLRVLPARVLSYDEPEKCVASDTGPLKPTCFEDHGWVLAGPTRHLEEKMDRKQALP